MMLHSSEFICLVSSYNKVTVDFTIHLTIKLGILSFASWFLTPRASGSVLYLHSAWLAKVELLLHHGYGRKKKLCVNDIETCESEA